MGRPLLRARKHSCSVGIAGVLCMLMLAAPAEASGAIPTVKRGTRTSPPLVVAPRLTAWVVQAKDASRASIVPSPGRPGQSALRLNVKPGDTEVAGSGPRAERTDAWLPTKITDAYEGREQWWSWSTYFPADYQPTASTAWNCFLDFHHTGDTGQANINLLADTHFNPPVMELTAYGHNTGQATYKLGSVMRERWYDFSLHVVWSASSRVGLIELYLNGRRVIRPQHRATLYAGEGAYLKLANYRMVGGGDSAILTANVRRTRTYAAALRGFAPFSTWARKAAPRKGSR